MAVDPSYGGSQAQRPLDRTANEEGDMSRRLVFASDQFAAALHLPKNMQADRHD